jgi:hypothetical protein
MQKMMFIDNAGTKVLPFTQNTSNCVWSASVDTESGKNDILLKVINKSAIPESVLITLNGSGKVNPSGHFSMLNGTPDSENSLSNPTLIVPTSGTFPAGKSFTYLFPAYSATIIRIGNIK